MGLGLLSLIAGMTDVIGWLTLDGVFTAHITGNIVVVAADVVRSQALEPAQVLAIPLFALISFIGFLVARRCDHRRRPLVPAFLLLQTSFLALALLTAVVAHASAEPNGGSAGLVGLLAVTAMAFQNTMLHLTQKKVSTTAVMTGNIVLCAVSLARMIYSTGTEHETARADWNSGWPLLAGFILGCTLGAVAVDALQDGAWIAPLVISCAMMLHHRMIARSATTATD